MHWLIKLFGFEQYSFVVAAYLDREFWDLMKGLQCSHYNMDSKQAYMLCTIGAHTG